LDDLAWQRCQRALNRGGELLESFLATLPVGCRQIGDLNRPELGHVRFWPRWKNRPFLPTPHPDSEKRKRGGFSMLPFIACLPRLNRSIVTFRMVDASHLGSQSMSGIFRCASFKLALPIVAITIYLASQSPHANSPPASSFPATLPSKTDPFAAPKRDAQGFTIHSLAQRIDIRSTEELETELLAARELTLDAQAGQGASRVLLAHAKKMQELGQSNMGTVVVLRDREDLAGLPFRIGSDAVLVREKAKVLEGFSLHLRKAIQDSTFKSMNEKTTATQPDIEALHKLLNTGKNVSIQKQNEKQFVSADAVPCIQQILQTENPGLRRMACELLSEIDVPEATEALVSWAVFDTDAGNRAAAVDALRKRDRKQLSQFLVSYIRYPWPRAVEHTAEALVSLNCQEAIPQLAAAYNQPDPDAPFRVDLPDMATDTYRREVVRINHLRNCVMCHAPALESSDLLRGAVPDPQEPLPPSTSPVYYIGGWRVVKADITYLRQDFSVFQPVKNHGPWPKNQRYDYFVTLTRLNSEPTQPPATATTAESTCQAETVSPYREAIRFAITELSLRDPDRNKEWMDVQQKAAGKAPDIRVGDVARYITLSSNPPILISLFTRESVAPLLSLSGEDLSKSIRMLQERFGTPDARLALIAYLTPLTQTGKQQAKAARLVAVLTGKTTDTQLPSAMSQAADETNEAT
jgi:hypothetical protein